jgi:hypothetical protein
MLNNIMKNNIFNKYNLNFDNNYKNKIIILIKNINNIAKIEHVLILYI